MGRHSRGGGATPPVEPAPPAPAPPAPALPAGPRSVEDTGAWDRSTYRVVDVGLPAAPPRGSASTAFPLGGAAPGGRSLRSVPEEPARGRRRAGERPEPGYEAVRRGGEDRYGTAPSRYGATRADLAPTPRRPEPGPALRPPGSRPSTAPGPGLRPLGDTGAGLRPLSDTDTGSGLRPLTDTDTGSGLRPLTDTGSGLRPFTDTGSGLRPLSDTGSGLRPFTDTRSGLRPLTDTGSGLRPDAGPGSSAGPGSGPGSFGDPGAGLRTVGGDPRASMPGLHPLGAAGGGVHPLDDRAAEPDGGRAGRRRAAGEDRGGRRRHEGGRRKPGEDLRYGATRADLADPAGYGIAGHGAGTAGRGAGAGTPGGTTTGAARIAAAGQNAAGRRVDAGVAARATTAGRGTGTLGSAALADPDPLPGTAPEPDEITDTGARRTRSTFHVAEDPEEDEPSLLLQWGVFVAQTLTGAAAGLGVWLGFYRLWSVWPFYAAPAVGAATILMLVVARTLRRRHGHPDLDLLTAVVTIGVATVLTVLPAAFTLQSLA